MPESTPEPGHVPGPGEITVSTTPLLLAVRPLDDERVPAGQAGLGCYLGNRLVARNAFPAQFVARLPLDTIFSRPVPLVFQAEVGGPGIRGTLFAAVATALLRDIDEPPEPWAASVPRFEDSVPSEEDGRTLFPLGVLVRVARDRKFPDDLAREAADLLQTALTGQTHEVIDRVLDDLLNS